MGVGNEWQPDMEEAESLSAWSVSNCLIRTHKAHTSALTLFTSNNKKCLYSQDNDE